MQQSDPCIICKLPDQLIRNGSHMTSIKIICKRCGEFEWGDAPPYGHATRQVRMSGYVRDQNAASISPFFNTELVKFVETLPMPRLVDRSRRLLATIVKKWGLNNSIYGFTDDLELQAVSYSADEGEVRVLFRLLEHEGLIDLHQGSAVRITPKGYVEAEQLSSSRSASTQGFVAMSFDSSMTDSYVYGFAPAITTAGYKPLRIDGKEHVNSISDEILSEIRRSRFIVADYTLTNNGVYFEAGFAIGLGVTVIPTCRKDYLKQLHFDVRHINTLEWETPAQLSQKLAARISAVIGDGPFRAIGH